MLSMSWRMVRLLTDKYENDTLEDRKNDMAEEADLAETAPLIVCDSLVKIYKTKEVEVLALQGLDLTVNRGELMAIIGKSGSGKSTLMNIVGGLEVPSAGRNLQSVRWCSTGRNRSGLYGRRADGICFRI